MSSTEFWMLVAGLGLFLYGMSHLEEALKQMEGRSFKLFLQKNTKQKLRAIFSGTIVTGLLQSSSIVNLMVLSLVGAGILTMRNAMAVVLGANIGGTFNSWLVALLGFKVELNSITFPLIGLSGISLIVFNKKKNLNRIALFFMGIGMLFLGLQFMKESMDSLMKAFDFTPYLSYPSIVFLLLGFAITAVVQTSSATVVVVLAALYSHIIPIETAIAVVLGAELGTTVKLILGAIGGNAAKKRVALGNSLFNVFTSAGGFIFIQPIIAVIAKMGISDPILILVAFQTFINIAGVSIIYFFLNPYGDFLDKQFKEIKKTYTTYLTNASIEIPSTVTDMIKKEVEAYIYKVMAFNLASFHLKPTWIHSYQSELPLLDAYQILKETEGEILAFFAKTLPQLTETEEISPINQLMESLRNAMYSAKCMKDIYADKTEFSNSTNETKYEMYHELQASLNTFYLELYQSLSLDTEKNPSLNLDEFTEQTKKGFNERIEHYYFHAGQNSLKEKDISTLFNLNREIYSSCKAIALAVEQYKNNTN